MSEIPMMTRDQVQEEFRSKTQVSLRGCSTGGWIASWDGHPDDTRAASPAWGATQEEALARSLGVELAPDPEALGIAEVVVELEAKRANAIPRERGTGVGPTLNEGFASGLEEALSLLRRVTPGDANDSEDTRLLDVAQAAGPFVYDPSLHENGKMFADGGAYTLFAGEDLRDALRRLSGAQGGQPR